MEIEHVGDSGDSDYVPEEPPPSDPNAPGEMGKPYILVIGIVLPVQK